LNQGNREMLVRLYWKPLGVRP